MRGDHWAATNRIMCDFFHRGLPPRRPLIADRTDVLFVLTGAAA